ncbi:MAG TPA: hypothetical protein VGB00_02490 [Pyrinomonadaceae bacterium]|jgi:hypothetical protein
MFLLNFEKLLYYDTGELGINIDVSLRLGDRIVNFVAKVDTGASHCIFEHQYGGQLRLKIEEGIVQRFSTATGTFVAYGHNLTLVTNELEFDSYVFFYSEDNVPKPNVLG